MSKKLGKILATTLCGVTAFGLVFSAGCSNMYSRTALTGDGIFTTDDATSNGGFIVEKGNYIYFINGVESYTATNSFGTPVKGSLMRISKSDFAAANYANAEIVVPSVIYSGSYNSGIYIYGDYVFYSTPSTARDSDGEILNSQLDFKCAKLDGSAVMKGYIFRSSSNSIDYRFVEVDGSVYLLYVLSEDLDGEGSTTNIHSVKIDPETGKTTDTLLVYDAASTLFPEDIEDPYIYYTMSVTDNNVSYSSYYNQVYRVRADDTTAITFDRSKLIDNTADSDDDDDDDDDAILYQNYGDLLFDGIGYNSEITPVTQFNYEYKDGEKVTTSATHTPYTYTLSSVQDGYIYYTIAASSTASYFYRTPIASFDSESWNPVTANPESNGQNCYILGYTDYTNPKFVKVGNTEKLIFEEDSKLKIGDIVLDDESNPAGGYTVANSFAMMDTASVTYLFTQEEGGYQYLYYATSASNGYGVSRIAYNGQRNDYTGSLTNQLPVTEETTAYTSVTILSVDASSDWYLPELIEGQLVFASEIEEMNSYNYIQVVDLRASSTSSATITNAQIEQLNNLYTGVMDTISDIDSTTYENLPNAIKYYFWASTTDSEAEGYLADLIQAYVTVEGKKETYLYSAESVAMFHEFAKLEGTFEKIEVDGTEVKFADYSKTINGDTVYANQVGYFYSILGTMTDDDLEAYNDDIKASYMQDYPTDDSTWWDNLSTVAKVFFIIGVCVGGLLVLAALALGGLLLWHKKKTGKKSDTSRRRFKIDTTDDKNIDVYGTEEGKAEEDSSEQPEENEAKDEAEAEQPEENELPKDEPSAEQPEESSEGASEQSDN